MAGTGTGGAGGPGRRERIGAPTTSKKAAPPEIPAGGPMVSIAAELRELASLRDSGILTDEEFSEQKKRLLAY
jgi:putative oligomerization/nucleic acid binding protein